MTLAYIIKFSITTQKTSIKAHKIDRLPLELYRKILAKF